MRFCWVAKPAAIARAVVLVAACVSGLLPVSAQANPYDISLRGLGRPQQQSLKDPAVMRYHALSAELALALAPRAMQPAETLGMSGFEFSVSNTLADISEGADYWQGQPGMPVMEGVLRNRKVPSNLWITTAHLRKGLPMSTEIGIQGSYLAFSEMFLLGAEFKLALHESFVRWIPALSGRIAFGRLFGSSDLDLFTAEADVMLSQAFGVGGMAQVTPYLGGGQLFTNVNSYVIDETPYSVTDPVNDQKGGATGSLYNFPELKWNETSYLRVFAGVRINVAMIELLYEFTLGVVDFNNTNLASHSFKLGFDV